MTARFTGDKRCLFAWQRRFLLTVSEQSHEFSALLTDLSKWRASTVASDEEILRLARHPQSCMGNLAFTLLASNGADMRIPTVIRKYFSFAVARNVLCLTLGVLFFVWGNAKSSANLVTQTSCRALTIGPNLAYCYGIAFCDWPFDNLAWVSLSQWNNTTCPNFFPPVADSVALDGNVGQSGIVSTARSQTVPLGRIVALGFAFQDRSGLAGSGAEYFMANCQDYVPPPNICFMPGCYGGGGGGGDCALDPFCGGGDGCSYCQDNWMTSAQCHNQFDTVCPL